MNNAESKETGEIKELAPRFKVLFLQANPEISFLRGRDAEIIADCLRLEERDKHILIARVRQKPEMFPFSVEPYAGIIITGSGDVAWKEKPWKKEGEEFIRRAHEKGIPILGVCFGAQHVAKALGGKVGRNPDGREFGWCKIRRTTGSRDDELFKRIPSSFWAIENHRDAIFRLPPGGILLAENEYGVQAFRVGQSTYGVMFHPEREPEVVERYIKERKEKLKEEGFDPDELLVSSRRTPEAQKIVSNFLDIVLKSHYQ